MYTSVIPQREDFLYFRFI